MTTDHLTQEQRQASTLFLEGAGWGFGGAVASRRPLRLDRRHRHDRARRALDRHDRHPPHAGADDGADADAAHARVLAVRIRRLKARLAGAFAYARMP